MTSEEISFMTDPNEDRHFIYFIESRKPRRVKIGLSNNPASRLVLLQPGSPVPIYLAATWGPVNYAVAWHTEAALHEMFADDRMHGEPTWPSRRLTV